MSNDPISLQLMVRPEQLGELMLALDELEMSRMEAKASPPTTSVGSLDREGDARHPFHSMSLQEWVQVGVSVSALATSLVSFATALLSLARAKKEAQKQTQTPETATIQIILEGTAVDVCAYEDAQAMANAILRRSRSN
jgi:hypothetical protein